MRKITKPSTAKCNLSLYTLFFLAEPQYVSCVRLAQILQELFDDSINRFLGRERYTPKDLFDEVKGSIQLEGGTLSGDDTVIAKPYSDPKKAESIDYFWSGKHKKVVKGINLITLYYTDNDGVSVPVNYRIYNKQEGKTKNDYFREMIAARLAWDLKPSMVTGDSWYASADNLKFIRHRELSFLFGSEKNRSLGLPGIRQVLSSASFRYSRYRIGSTSQRVWQGQGV